MQVAAQKALGDCPAAATLSSSSSEGAQGPEGLLLSARCLSGFGIQRPEVLRIFTSGALGTPHTPAELVV